MSLVRTHVPVEGREKKEPLAPIQPAARAKRYENPLIVHPHRVHPPLTDMRRARKQQPQDLQKRKEQRPDLHAHKPADKMAHRNNNRAVAISRGRNSRSNGPQNSPLQMEAHLEKLQRELEQTKRRVPDPTKGGPREEARRSPATAWSKSGQPARKRWTSGVNKRKSVLGKENSSKDYKSLGTKT